VPFLFPAGQFQTSVAFLLLLLRVLLEPRRSGDHDFDLMGSRDVIRHVTIGLAVYGFVLVVNLNQPSISHGCRDMESLVYDLVLFESRDVVGLVAIEFVLQWFPNSYIMVFL